MSALEARHSVGEPPGPLLAHPNPIVRALVGWAVGLVLFAAVWAAGYLWLPRGVSVGLNTDWLTLPLGGDGVTSWALRIFVNNLLLAGGFTVVASLFSVGRLSLGYLPPWLWFAFYGYLLGTNSFQVSDPGGALAPTIAVLWERAGLRELAAYLLVAAGLARAALWRQESFWSLRARRVRGLREVRLSRAEVACLAIAGALLAWAAWTEASAIVAGAL